MWCADFEIKFTNKIEIRKIVLEYNQTTRIRLAVIGLGYVGLPLAIAFSHKRDVVAFDISKHRVEELKDKIDSTGEVVETDFTDAIQFTSDIRDLSNSNFYIIAVPTPVNDQKAPDIKALLSATKMVAGVLKERDIVVYESTVYPGMTEEICIPQLERVSGLRINQDFYCGYSPERVNPGDAMHGLNSVVKLTSGSTMGATEIIDELYREVVAAGTYMTESIKIAEAAKVIENTQRDLNIALVNELSKIFHAVGISTEKVLQAADTKWNFHKYVPGLVGGHCIGVDPYYLVHKAESTGVPTQLILAGRNLNDGMSTYVASELSSLFQARSLELKGASVLVLGVTFKENCGDVRNSKVFDLCNSLSMMGIDVYAHDPYVDKNILETNFGLLPVTPFEETNKFSAIIVAVGHDYYRSIPIQEFRKTLVNSGVIMDLKWIFPEEDSDWRF